MTELEIRAEALRLAIESEKLASARKDQAAKEALDAHYESVTAARARILAEQQLVQFIGRTEQAMAQTA